ncbi:MAG: dipeptide ABC transporter ATP-binding protein [Desulfocapsaceae bacterium]|nr:dipeptide ABC transporter ATP-binding protein [Desulfocapsaceae bacterium]
MLLEIDRLNAWFSVESDSGVPEDRQVLRDISFSLGKGETVALVGESGSGKSVTALSILRLPEENSRIRYQGKIRYEGVNLFSLSAREIRSYRGNRIAMIFQEPMISLNPVYPVGRQLIEPLLLHRSMSSAAARTEAIRLLERTGIDDPAERLHIFPHQLSGGQRQRVMIAMALACRPDLLIADEPTTALDVTIQAQILELIKDIQQEYGMAVLLITHDLAMVSKMAAKVHIMQSGRIVEQGETGQILNCPEHPYTRRLLASVSHQPPAAKTPGPALLTTRDLECSFQMKGGWKNPFSRTIKTIKAVDRVSLTIPAGTTCGIVGESGSGKTTLGMAILKLVKSTGDIVFGNRDLQSLVPREMRPLRKEIQVVFQDPYSSLSPRLTAAEIVSEGLQVHFRDQTRAERTAHVAAALTEVGLEPEMGHRYPHEFSGGQRQRIAIARAIALRPRFMILDEPTSALDMTIQAQVIELLKDLQQRYAMTYMFISHDLRVIRALADQIVVMQQGRIVETGPAAEIFDCPRQDYTKTLFQAALG